MKIDRKLLKYITSVITVAVLIILCLLSGGVCLTRTTAFADTLYSDVLDDLQKDNNFDLSKYSEISDDYSLQVIQIAESENGELFIYVYQPSGQVKQFTAMSINISTAINDNLKYVNYGLKLLNSNGVFYKYKAVDFEVKEDTVRYYDISSIFRKWDLVIDGEAEDTERAFIVGQLWTACTVNGAVTYSMHTTAVVEIKPEQKHCGYLRYKNGWLPFGYVEKCDSHYIAFNCNYNIDVLYEADVSYVEQRYHLTQSFTENLRPQGNPISDTVYLKGEDKGGNTVNGLLASAYEWKRIERAEDFINNPDNNLSNETKEILKDKQWVLRYKETVYEQYQAFGGLVTEYSAMTEVTILRLKFKMNGEVYNLGVVDNKRTEKPTPDNPNQPLFPNVGNNMPWWVWLIIAVSIILVVSLLCMLIRPVITLIMLPFKAIAWLFKKIFGGGD